MALTDESTGNGFYMPVAPAYGGGGGFGNGNGDFGNGWWILLLLLAFGGWGNNGFGGGFGGGYGAMMGADFGLYPWLNNSQHISDGFRDQMLNTNVASISDKLTSGFGDVANQLCGGFAGVNASIANAQMNNMQNIFGLTSALQNCCCESRAGIADLKYTVATENCADRAALSDGIRDVLAATQAQTQSILDKMCQLELDGYKREADNLRTQLNMSTLRESQVAQTAQIREGQLASVNSLVNELRSCPIPAQPVYGSQPIFTCPNNLNNNGCGCGCNGNGF